MNNNCCCGKCNCKKDKGHYIGLDRKDNKNIKLSISKDDKTICQNIMKSAIENDKLNYFDKENGYITFKDSYGEIIRIKV